MVRLLEVNPSLRIKLIAMAGAVVLALTTQVGSLDAKDSVVPLDICGVCLQYQNGQQAWFHSFPIDWDPEASVHKRICDPTDPVDPTDHDDCHSDNEAGHCGTHATTAGCSGVASLQLDLSKLLAAYDARDFTQVRELMTEFPADLHYLSDRQAIEVVGCGGAIIVYLAVEPYAAEFFSN